jgi:hypothetical protein
MDMEVNAGRHHDQAGAVDGPFGTAGRTGMDDDPSLNRDIRTSPVREGDIRKEEVGSRLHSEVYRQEERKILSCMIVRLLTVLIHTPARKNRG